MVCDCQIVNLNYGHCSGCYPWSYWNVVIMESILWTGDDGCGALIYCDYDIAAGCM
jgi:hypothetical protein